MIRTSGLRKSFGKVVALDCLDLEVPKSTVLALLGPNGAGKTTAIRILSTLLLPDEGEAEIAGINVVNNPEKIRELIGLSGQSAAVDEYLTGYENLEMVGRLYHLGRGASRTRARELLQEFDLEEAASRSVKTYSGGMRRRLDLAAALVASPQVLFLDEPTTGLDPRSRAQMWDTITSLVKAGSTVLLTTQYMEEADRLADDIVVIDRGQMIAHGNSGDLKKQIGGERIEVVVAEESDFEKAKAILSNVCLADLVLDEAGRRITAAVTEGPATLERVLSRLNADRVGVADIGLRHPTLDDVFLTVTGHAAEEKVAELVK